MNSNVVWHCICDCGSTVMASGRDLRTGHTRSCGCLKAELTKKRFIKHGQHGSRLYMVWQEMLARCYRPTSTSFQFYGARGINVCEAWRDSFEAFAADMGPPPPGYSLERKNNDLGYSKENCRWATRVEQMNNRRNNIIITFGDNQLPMAEFARMLGFPYAKVRSAVKRGAKKIGGYEISAVRRSELFTLTQPENDNERSNQQ